MPGGETRRDKEENNDGGGGEVRSSGGNCENDKVVVCSGLWYGRWMGQR